jgi:hypothetical protein
MAPAVSLTGRVRGPGQRRRTVSGAELADLAEAADEAVDVFRGPCEGGRPPGAPAGR